MQGFIYQFSMGTLCFLFSLYHENYPRRFGKFKDIVKMSDLLSFVAYMPAYALFNNYQTRVLNEQEDWQEHATALMTLGSLIYNKNSVPSKGMETINRSRIALFDNERQERVRFVLKHYPGHKYRKLFEYAQIKKSQLINHGGIV